LRKMVPLGGRKRKNSRLLSVRRREQKTEKVPRPPCHERSPKKGGFAATSLLSRPKGKKKRTLGGRKKRRLLPGRGKKPFLPREEKGICQHSRFAEREPLRRVHLLKLKENGLLASTEQAYRKRGEGELRATMREREKKRIPLSWKREESLPGGRKKRRITGLSEGREKGGGKWHPPSEDEQQIPKHCEIGGTAPHGKKEERR